MSKKSLSILLAGLAGVVLVAPSVPALPHATARLNGAQEVPPVNTPATGTGSFSLNETRSELTYTITVEGLTSPITLAHFHRGATGVNGPPVRTFTASFTGNTATGIWRSTDAEPLTPALVAEILAGNTYANVHTQQNGGGEIRGQVDVIAGLHLSASLTGNQEVPPTGSAATGTAVFTLTDAGLAYDLTVEGLQGNITLAHFHSGGTGQNGPPVRTFTASFTGNTATGIWTKNDVEPLTPTLIELLLGHGIYVNVHTTAFGGGEIRGQIEVKSSSGLTGRLDGAQEVPPVVTPAKGTASCNLNQARNALYFDLTVQGLSSPITLAHFHNAPAGVNGPPVRTFTASFTGNTATGIWRSTDAEPLTPALVNELLAGRIYANVHTQQNGGGEIRSQLRLTTGIGRTAALDGAQEVPPVVTPATGTGSFVLTDQGVVFDATVEGLQGPITLAHFHNAAAGVNGPVVKTITTTFTGNTATGLWSSSDAEALTPTQIGNYLAGNLYLNVHTTVHGGGEIRGQLLGLSVVGIGPAESPGARAALVQNFPNPFNPTTTIRYELARREAVALVLYDVDGREVATLLDEPQAAGTREFTLDASGLASGVYFYRLETPSFTATRKLVLTK